MPKILIRWLINSIAIIIVAHFYPGIQVASFMVAIIVAVALGIINAFLRPILIVLTLPINILTLGLFTFVINGFSLWLTSLLISGFEVRSFLAAVFGSILISIISIILGFFVK